MPFIQYYIYTVWLQLAMPLCPLCQLLCEMNNVDPEIYNDPLLLLNTAKSLSLNYISIVFPIWVRIDPSLNNFAPYMI